MQTYDYYDYSRVWKLYFLTIYVPEINKNTIATNKVHRIENKHFLIYAHIHVFSPLYALNKFITYDPETQFRMKKKSKVIEDIFGTIQRKLQHSYDIRRDHRKQPDVSYSARLTSIL